MSFHFMMSLCQKMSDIFRWTDRVGGGAEYKISKAVTIDGVMFREGKPYFL